MGFKSILFPETDTKTREILIEAPDYFKDLNLHQIIESIIKDQEYLRPFFYTPLQDANIIEYRQQVMNDLEDKALFSRIKSFSNNIRAAVISISSIVERLASKDSYLCNYVEKGRMLEAAKTYCEELSCLARNLSFFSLKSKGLKEFQKYVLEYIEGDYFKALLSDTSLLKEHFGTIQYCMLINGNSIKVQRYGNEKDYSAEIEEIFSKFKQGSVKDYRKKLFEEPYAEHVEAGVLDLVAKLYPEVFSELDEYIIKNKNFLNEVIVSFANEIQFYIVYLEYIEGFKQAGLRFCYPEMLLDCKEIYCYEGFDLALAGKLISEGKAVVSNDFYLNDSERIIIISGPNQGGKTTFARAFGQIQHLSSIGCQVPGRKAGFFLFDNIFTHFEKEEDVKTLNGKLKDELIRMHYILSTATSKSIIIINEILSSTTLEDAFSIGKKVIAEIEALDCLCLWVTFIDELDSLSKKSVSMVSTVEPVEPTRRTYKIIRSPADGIAYAIHIAEKYQVTYNFLKERIRE